MKEPNLEIEVPEWIKIVKEVLRKGSRANKNHEKSCKEARR